MAAEIKICIVYNFNLICNFFVNNLNKKMKINLLLKYVKKYLQSLTIDNIIQMLTKVSIIKNIGDTV